MKKKMITVSLAACAFFGARAEETEYVYFTGEGGISVLDGPAMRVNTGTAKNPGWESPITNALSWSDKEVPHYGPFYVASPTNGIDVFVTPHQTQDYDYNEFRTLILRGAIKLLLCQKSNTSATFNDLRIEADAGKNTPEIQLSNNKTHLDGFMTIENDARVMFRNWNSMAFFIESEIRGDGDIVFSTIGTGESNKRVSYYYLCNMNTNFHGRIYVKKVGSVVSQYCSLSITNEYNLGGKLDSFTYDALNLTRYSRLIYDGSDKLVLSKETKRGLSVGVNNGLIYVNKESAVFEVNWPITLGVTILQKVGAGRLILGSALRFTNVLEATSENPTDSKENPTSAGNHCFDVRQGSLSLTHCDALNGAKIAFSNNTEMVMSIDLPEGDMKRYGMKCTKIAEPFATDVPIKLVESEKGSLTESKYAVAIATVKAEYAETAKAKLSVMLEDVNNYRLVGMRYVANEKENEDDPDTVTFYADILHNGLVISVG